MRKNFDLSFINLEPFGKRRVFYTDNAPPYGDDSLIIDLPRSKPVKSDTLLYAAKNYGVPLHIAVEFHVPRNVHGGRVQFAAEEARRIIDLVNLEYWYDRWTGPVKGGWIPIDDPWNGSWRRGNVRRLIVDERTVDLLFGCLTEREGPITPYYGQPATNIFEEGLDYRRALKFRFVFDRCFDSEITDIKLFGMTEPSKMEVDVVFLPKSLDFPSNIEISDILTQSCTLLSVHPLCLKNHESPKKFRVERGEAKGVSLEIEVLPSQAIEDPSEESMLTLCCNRGIMTILLSELKERKIIDVRDKETVFLIPSVESPFERVSYYRKKFAFSKRIRQRVLEHSEQTWNRCKSDTVDHRKTCEHFISDTWQPFGLFPLNQRLGVDELGEICVGFDLPEGPYRSIAETVQKDFFRWKGNRLIYRFGTGKPPLLLHWGAKSKLDESGIPFLELKWSDGRMSYAQEVFLAFHDHGIKSPDDVKGEPPATGRVQINVKNVGSEMGPVLISLQTLIEGVSKEYGVPVLLFRQRGVERLPERLTVNQNLIIGEQVRARFSSNDSWDVRPDVLKVEGENGFSTTPLICFSRELEVGQSASIEFEIPILSLTVDEYKDKYSNPVSHEKAKEQMKRYWQDILLRKMAKISVPDRDLIRLWNSNLVHILSCLRIEDGIWHVPAATWDYTECPNETYYVTRLLDMRGLHEWAFKTFEGLIIDQGKAVPPGAYTSSEGALYKSGVHVDITGPLAYGLHLGGVLATVAFHAKMRRDSEWTSRYADAIARACEFIIRERKPTQRYTDKGEPVPEFGLLVPGKQEDNPTWGFWLGNNAWAYKGLKEGAEVLAKIRDPRAQRFLEEAEQYKRDIINAFSRASEKSPMVTLADGKAVPHIPPEVKRPGRGRGWINEALYGALQLHTCGLLCATDPIIEDVLDDFEDNIALSKTHNLDVPPHPDQWFSEGGRLAQETMHNAFLCYLERDEVPAALRVFFNTLRAILHPEMCYTAEFSEYAGHYDGSIYKPTDESSLLMWLRFMLVYEEANRLRLFPCLPREWLREGRHVSIHDAPTIWGSLSIEATSWIESKASIHVTVDLREIDYEVPLVVLRLRHPEISPINSVIINGITWNKFNIEREEIVLPQGQQKLEITVLY